MPDDSAKRRLRRQRYGQPAAPIESDDEKTPAPAAAPGPDQTAPIHEQVAWLTEHYTELASGLQRVWPARHDGDRLDKIDGKIEVLQGYAKEHATLLHEFAMPAVKDLMSRCDEVLRAFPQAIASNERVVDSINAMSKRLQHVEDGVSSMRDHSSNLRHDVDDINKRLAETTVVANMARTRLDDLDRARALEKAGTVAVTTFKAKNWKLIVTIVAAVGPALGWLAKTFF